MAQLTLDSCAGAALKQAGLDQVESDTGFLELMREYAKVFSDGRGQVTTDDLRMVAANLGVAPRSSHSWGAIFRGKGWKVIGRKKSAVPENHNREIRVWHYEI